MTSFFIDDGLASLHPIQLSSAIAQGAAGTIHHVIGEPGIVAKLYKNPNDLPEYEKKIAAMLASPPQLPAFSYKGRTYVQIAWPTATVRDGGGFRGFVMPEVNFQDSTELENILQKSVRQRKQLPEFYGARVLLAANLAALMAELHALGHYMIDMKPMNMRFYPQAWYMAILDTDGFSINGKHRLPAQQFSDEYIAPDAKGQKPEQLGLEQDLFALAVIIFRLLNNGVHPYQGVDTGNYPTTLQERIFAGLYTYGMRGHRDVKPARSSIHEYLEDDTRVLFDEAFRAGSSRPTAAQWRDHINGLINNKVLIKCPMDPKKHGHFSKGCGFCVLEQRLAVAGNAGTRAPSSTMRPVQTSGQILNALHTGTGQSAGSGAANSSAMLTAMPTSTTSSSPSRNRVSDFWIICAVIGGVVAFALTQLRNSETPFAQVIAKRDFDAPSQRDGPVTVPPSSEAGRASKPEAPTTATSRCAAALQHRNAVEGSGYEAVNGDSVNIRSGPTTDCPTIDANTIRPLMRRASVRILSTADDGWKEVETVGVDGKLVRGFVFGSLLAALPTAPLLTATATASTPQSQSLDEILLQRSVPTPAPTVTAPPATIAPSVTVRCNNSKGFIAPDGIEWDGSTLTNLREGTVIAGAVPYKQPSDGQRFYKGQLGGRTVFVKESDIDGINCDTRTWWTIPKPEQCPPGFVPEEGWLCHDRYGQKYAVGGGRAPPPPPNNRCPPGQGRHPVTGLCVPNFYTLH
jgi:hypothetical protein